MTEESPPPSQFLVLVSWEAPEYEYREKSGDWYWAVGIVTVGFLALALILKNFLFAIIVAIAGFTLAVYGARPPRVIPFAITSRGVKIGNVLYPYETLKSFWINYDPPHIREIYLISKKFLMPQISLPLAGTDPNEVREHLLKFLEEKEIQESLSDTIARFFRF